MEAVTWWLADHCLWPATTHTNHVSVRPFLCMAIFLGQLHPNDKTKIPLKCQKIITQWHTVSHLWRLHSTFLCVNILERVPNNEWLWLAEPKYDK